MTRKTSQLNPAINRIRLDKLTIFEISEAELESLEQGSQESLFLNLGIASGSVAASFLTTLLSTHLELRTFCVFTVIVSVGILAAITFTLLWWRMRKSMRTVGAEIRSRMSPAEGIQAETDAT